MRLKQHITEMYLRQEEMDDCIAKLKKNCKPFFKKASGGNLLWRGSNKPMEGEYIIKVKTRKDRKPKDMNLGVHEIVDDMFLKHKKWRARSQGVFATEYRSTASAYGIARLMFPIGNFKFLYNPNITDLYQKILNLGINYSGDIVPEENMDQEFKTKAKVKRAELEKIIKGYKSTNLSQNKDTEIAILCKAYYLVDVSDGRLYGEIERLFDEMT